MNSTNKQNLILGVVAVAILAGIAWVSLRDMSGEIGQSATSMKAADVLSPSLFSDEKTRAAYQAAKDYPEVLEQMPCFCGCMLEGINHKNNLFCFKDSHGAG